MKAREETSPWLLFLFVLGCAVLVSLLSGCATTRQSVEVTAVYSGERQEVIAKVCLESIR